MKAELLLQDCLPTHLVAPRMLVVEQKSQCQFSSAAEGNGNGDKQSLHFITSSTTSTYHNPWFLVFCHFQLLALTSHSLSLSMYGNLRTLIFMVLLSKYNPTRQSQSMPDHDDVLAICKIGFVI